jgi:hypothetical protein
VFDFLAGGVLHLWEIDRLHFNLVPAKENYSVILCHTLFPLFLSLLVLGSCFDRRSGDGRGQIVV